jgi:hypothetical protein
MPIVMTYDDATIRYRLRLARTGVQVGTPEKEARKRTFWAALEQFEDLLDAAGTVGPASRPLPLFYALSQAGRAITAAHGSLPWQLQGHGLTMLRPSSPQHLLEKVIIPRPGSRDSFHRVAQTIGSNLLTGPVELGALWASLPYDLPETWAEKWPTPLPLEPLVRPTGRPTDEAAAEVRGFKFDQLTVDALREALEQYPSAQGWDLPEGDRPSDRLIGGRISEGWKVWLVWRANGTSIDDRLAKLAEVAPAYRRRGHHWLRPSVGAQKDYLKPLITWWLLLFGLSILARYEPAVWVEALSITESDIAADLEALLDDAMLAIPQLVLEALERQPFLVTQ